MEDGTLQDALEAQRRLRLAVFLLFRNQRGGGIDEVLKVDSQLVQIGTTGAQDIGSGGIVQQCQQEVFHGHEFVAFGTCHGEGRVQGQFKFFAQHGKSPLGRVLDGSLRPVDVAQQRMLALSSILIDLVAFRFRDVATEDATGSFSLMMDSEHDLYCLLLILVEKGGQHLHDEVHRREVIIVQNDLVHGRWSQFRLSGLECQITFVVFLVSGCLSRRGLIADRQCLQKGRTAARCLCLEHKGLIR